MGVCMCLVICFCVGETKIHVSLRGSASAVANCIYFTLMSLDPRLVFSNWFIHIPLNFPTSPSPPPSHPRLPH